MKLMLRGFFCVLMMCFVGAASTLSGAPALASADLSVTLADAPDPVLAGGNISYAIAMRNDGPDAAASPALSTSVPASATFQSISVAPGWTCIVPAVGGTGSINCSASSLAAGSSVSFSVTVKVNAGTANGTSVNETVSATTVTPDPNGGNNSASVSTAVAAPDAADTSLGLSGAPAFALRGSNIVYTFTFRNNGPAAASSVQTGFSVPANTTFQGITPPPGWTCITPAVGGTGAVNCLQNFNFPSGTSVNFPLTVKVNAAAANGALVTVNGTSSSVSGSTDPNAANNAVSATTTVLVPSAASVSVAGRITTTDGRGVVGARVEAVDANGETRIALTNPFGFYRFANLPAGEVYVFSVRHKTHVFEARVVNLSAAVDDLNFIAASPF